MDEINRSNVNSPQVSAQDFPKSGFDLTYKTWQDFVLGRLHPQSIQFIMPGDKFSGSNDTKLTFNRLVVPQISDVEVSQHNFYIPFRAIDTSFIKGIVPTELNGMSSSWRTPSFNLQTIWQIFVAITDDSTLVPVVPGYTAKAFHRVLEEAATATLNTTALMDTFVHDFFRAGGYTITEALRTAAVNSYCLDWLLDFNTWIASYPMPSTVSTADERAALISGILDAYLTPFIGEKSLIDYLGYDYLRRADIQLLSPSLYSTLANASYQDYSAQEFDNIVGNILDTIPQCEYALRAYYAVWYEHYRDKYLEKRTNTLPDWRDFGSASLVGDSTGAGLIFLFTRIRSWAKDMFVGSMPDDISRHVYAPIIGVQNDAASPVTGVLKDNFQYMNAEGGLGFLPPNNTYVNNAAGYVNAALYSLSYRDPNTGSMRRITCPVPKAVNDSLSTLSANLVTFTPSVLDLRDLRKSQMIERYLKRNFYFGDEYEDRMLAHYGSKVSDNSIKRPHLLSSSVTPYNPVQEVSSVSTSEMPAGSRTATATAQGHGDGFEFFAEEFGVFISLISVRPKAQYAGIVPQHLMSQMTDFPLPEFANNNDEFGRVIEVATSGLVKNTLPTLGMFGHFPYAHAWRSRVDEVHGSFLSDKQDWTFRRFFGMDDANVGTTPVLNYQFIHCRPNLGMFANTNRLDGQGYFESEHHFFVERVLPTPVESI